MLVKQFPKPVKFICGFIYSQEEIYSKAKAVLVRKFGPIDLESQKIDFNFTDYYQPEMGRILYRRFVSFSKLAKPDSFAAIKNFCISLEKKYSNNSQRTVNIDPGYINEAKLVLTTTKDFSHRIYVGKGIYAEATLYYQQKKFQDYPFTFPDYRTQTYKDIFLKIRDIYRGQIHK